MTEAWRSLLTQWLSTLPPAPTDAEDPPPPTDFSETPEESAPIDPNGP